MIAIPRWILALCVAYAATLPVVILIEFTVVAIEAYRDFKKSIAEL